MQIRHNYYLVLAAFLALPGLHAAAWAQAPAAPAVKSIQAPRHVLFIGNSYSYYNNSLHGHVRSLVHAADPGARNGTTFRSMTVSGSFLRDHGPGLAAMLKSRRWDVVVLQGQSTEPVAARRAGPFRETVRDYERQIREAGARTALYMTWAWRGKPDMTRPLADAYVAAGNDSGSLVVPVGLAFERALKLRPDLVLHHSDDQHPSLEGTYLSACVFYAALYGRSPAGSGYTAGLPADTAAFLQRAAWETVQEFFGR
jgi:hypothetical protein